MRKKVYVIILFCGLLFPLLHVEQVRAVDPISISGTVRDEAGNPLGGVTIRLYANRIAGSDVQVDIFTTGADGYYSVSSGNNPDFEGYLAEATKTGYIDENKYFVDGLYSWNPIMETPNHPPTVSNLVFSPSRPTQHQTITVSYTYSDADGDPQASVSYLWRVNGVDKGTTSMLSSSNFNPGDLVWVRVTVSDGSATDSAEKSVVINHIPEVSMTGLNPNPCYTINDISVSTTTQDDDIGDTVSVSYIWKVDGIDLGVSSSTTTVSSSNYIYGNIITVEATPFDGYEYGTTKSMSTTVFNWEPSIDAASIVVSPLNPNATTQLTVTHDAVIDADLADEQSINIDYFWYVNDILKAGPSSYFFGPFEYIDEDIVKVDIVVSDGIASINYTKQIMIGNTAPVITEVILSPLAPNTEDSIIGVNMVVDPDLDTVQIWYDWFINGESVQTGLNPELDSSLFEYEDIVYVICTPNDGHVDGPAKQSDSISIVNFVPTLISIDFDQVDYYNNTDIECNPVGYDADSHSINFLYRWFKNSEELIGETSSMLLHTNFQKYDEIVVEVTPFDGIGVGDPMNSSIQEIKNSAPIIDDISLNPTTPLSSEDTTCNLIFHDDDTADIITKYYEWYVEDILIPDNNFHTLDSSYYEVDEKVAVIVKLFDGVIFSQSVEIYTTVGNSIPKFTQVQEDLIISEEIIFQGDQSLVWIIEDEDPDYYEIYLGAHQIFTGEWSSGNLITFLLNSSFTIGNYIIECRVYDTGGQMITDGVNVEVIDITVPEFMLNPPDATFPEIGPGFTLEWSATDQNPGDLYEVYQNGVLEFSGNAWNNEVIIEYFAFGLSKGEYHFKIVVYDSSMNNATDDVRISIVDLTAPIINEQEDLEYIEGSTGNLLDWQCSDAYPGTFEIYRDSVFQLSGVWISSESIMLNVDGLAVGSYNYTIFVRDGSNNLASDTVIIQVIEEQTSGTSEDPTNGNGGIPGFQMNLLLIVSLAGVMGLILNNVKKQKK